METCYIKHTNKGKSMAHKSKSRLDRYYKQSIISLCLSATLAACGGSSSDKKEAVNIAPIAIAGENGQVNEGVQYTLMGSGTDNDGTITEYNWRQIAGPSVTINDNTSSSASFLAPSVDEDVALSFELTVTDNDGATGKDLVEVNVVNVIVENQMPIAVAGLDVDATIGTTVNLNASESSDVDGSITSYLWTQVENGSPLLTINDAQLANASIVVPPLSDNNVFIFNLTVTDNEGAQSSDQISILGRPHPAINVGKVIGNTANLNALAEFTVSLASQPTANVTIDVTSSNEAEGLPDISSLTFTSENWRTPQKVNVFGQNDNVTDGIQDYHVVLSEAVSTDRFYNGINPSDVALKGIELVVEQLDVPLLAMPKVPFTYQVKPNYTGNNPLTFSVSNGPQGLTVDFNSGLVEWMPPASLDQGEITADIIINDGSRFTTFELVLNAPESSLIATQYEATNSTLTIDEPNTNLDAIVFTQINLEDDLSDLTLSKVDKDSLINIPNGIRPLTDGIIINGTVEDEISIRFPLSSLPTNISIDDVKFYSLVNISDSEEVVWSAIGYNRIFSGTEAEPFISYNIAKLNGIGFFGYHDDSTNSMRGYQLDKTALTSTNSVQNTTNVTCVQRTFFTFNIDSYDCTSSVDEAVSVNIDDWGDDTLRWTSVSKEQLVAWLVDARSEFSSQGLGFDDKFVVRVEPMSYLGYVSSAEDRKVLHITDDNTEAATSIQGTSVHEYYHHAQGHSDTLLANQKLAIDSGRRASWLYEGTARWVEDVIFDDLNTYVRKEAGTGSRILEVGLNGRHGEGRNRPYQRFSFFKLLDEKCTSLNNNMQNIFNYSDATDTTAVGSLSDELANMGCDFGEHFGVSNKSSLVAALGLYNVATQMNNSIADLDANEVNSTFNFQAPNYRFRPSLSNSIETLASDTNNTQYRLNNVSQIKSHGAISFKVPSFIGTLPEGKVAELLIESTSDVMVSITSNDSNFPGTNTINGQPHDWFTTASQSSFIYGEGVTNLPELFVTVINDNANNDATISVKFRVRDIFNVDTIISSHQSGDEVNDRVVNVVGNIPLEGREFTNFARITANGITTIVPVSSDGRFESSVIMYLGANTVKAQGFNGNNPSTREEIITLTGIDAGSVRRNALIPSRVVFVLRWDTATDIDIYSKDSLGETIWYRNRTVALGNLDVDDTSGFGPEVVSYRADGNSAYANGEFDIDVHYYSGSPSTNYTIDVILNETEGANRRNYHFSSIIPLIDSSSSDDGVDSEGTSRFNDILFVDCNAARVCGLKGFDSSKLSLSETSDNVLNMSSSMLKSLSSDSAKEKCETNKQHIFNKYGVAIESCDDQRLK